MKTKKMILKKLVKCLFISFIIFGLQSCETEIPITDTTDPAFSFQIKGDGFDHTFNQNTNFSQIQLNLRNDKYYEYTITGTDAGGVDLIQWQADTTGNIIFEFETERPWTARDIGSVSRMIEWRGDRNNPLTGASLRGTLRTQGTAHLIFRFYVRDYGGEQRVANISRGDLTINIGNHPSEIAYE